MTWSNISSAEGTSDLNSRHTVPPVNVFDICNVDIEGSFTYDIVAQ